MTTKPVLVTGSTGYVGGRLVPKLLESGCRVRALGRSIAKLKARPWAKYPLAELAAGDVLDYESLRKAAAGCRAAFYLVHSMGADPKGFTETDRVAAQNMARAAAEAGLEHIVYLGGLGNPDDPLLSKHLRSRHEVAEILQSGPVPATFLRAAMILGSGSASFEILRHPLELRVGDTLDFWRVLEVEPPHRLLLLAEMKLPGEAVLEFHLAPQGDGKVELKQTARFLPRGLGGIVYWYSLVPFHRWVYRGMLAAIAAAVGKLIVKGPEPCNRSTRRHAKE
jgi:hypothetical protein